LRSAWKPVLLTVCAVAIVSQSLYMPPSVHGETLAKTIVLLYCSFIPVNAFVGCGEQVIDLSPLPNPPTGTVTFSACCDPTGAFFPSSIWNSTQKLCDPTQPTEPCQIVGRNPCQITGWGGLFGELGTCRGWIGYPRIMSGPQTIFAAYSGDATHSNSSAKAVVNVPKHPSLTNITCTRDNARSTTCKAVVIDNDFISNFVHLPPITPTGTISWTSSGNGVFSSHECALSGTGSNASCAVTYREISKPSSQQINASYNGDPDHSRSSATQVIFPQPISPIFTPHAPIIISGNSDFTSANGVTDGKGTLHHPYIIQGWNITDAGCCGTGPANGWGISIVNTDAYFVIRNIISTGRVTDRFNPGLNMTHVTNGVIENVTVNGYPSSVLIDSSRNIVISNDGNQCFSDLLRIQMILSERIAIRHNCIFGMTISSSVNVSLTDNLVYGGGVSLEIEGSSGVIVSNTTISGCDCVSVAVGSSDHVELSRDKIGGDNPLLLTHSSFVELSDNQLEGGYGYLIDMNDCSDVSIQRNQILGTPEYGILRMDASERVGISNNTFGPSGGSRGDFDLLQVSYSKNITITANQLSRSATAIDISDSSNMLIEQNTIELNARGAVLNRTSNIRVFHNNFVGNSVQARDSESTNNVWDNGYPSGGNFWSDYTGMDNCSGPQQNICQRSDELGDTPYVFNYNQDNFPLMQPVLIAV
jgi:parallel beta-helix repeat protein